MQTLEVRPVRTAQERLRFIKFPWKIYREDPNWTPFLISERKGFLNPARNPYHLHAGLELFAAFRSRQLVGTIAANVDEAYNFHHNEKVGFFGLFECVNDREIAAALFDTAAHWLRQRGMEVMRGPANFYTHGECGLLIAGFDSPSALFYPYNPPYYRTLIEHCGFSKAIDCHAYASPGHGPPDHLADVAEKVARHSDVRIRTAHMNRYDDEIQHVKTIYNRSWRHNWGFVPLTDNDVVYMGKLLRPLLDPELCFVAEVKGEPVGLAVNLPDYSLPLRHMGGHLFPFGWLKFLWYKRKINALLVFFLGVLPEYHDLQIGALFYLTLWKAALKKGYQSLKTSWVYENNEPMNRALRWMGARIYKTYRAYDRRL